MTKTTPPSEYEVRILNYLKENPSGSTITDIANHLDYHRNTVSKYITFFELEGKAYTKEIGRYKLCYSAEGTNMPRTTFINIYKGVLFGLKKHFPNKENVFKEIGKDLVPFMPSTLINLPKIINESEEEFSLTSITELIEDIYQGFFQDPISIKKVEVSDDGKKIRVGYANSSFLKENDNFIYHVYMLAGFIEALLNEELDNVYECSIEKINISEENESSYVELLIQFI